VARTRTPLAWWVAALGLLARTATAEPRVELTDCGPLDADAIARHLADELAAMLGGRDRLEAPPIHIECTPGSLRVEVRDPLTGKTLARTLPAPRADDPTADRMVALAISELFVSSWLELLLPTAERASAPPAPAPQSLSVVRAQRVARRAVGPTGVRVDTSLLAGAGVRDVAQPYPTLRVGLRSGPVFGRVALSVGVGFETGRARRPPGDVTTQAVSLGLGGRWRAASGERLALDVVASGAAAYAIARGSSTRSTELASSASGAAAELALGLSPALAIGATELFLEPTVGLTVPRLSARVTGEVPVRWSGLWFGVTVGLRLGGRP
jgi:hypothetical protein